MDFSYYQDRSRATVIYPDAGSNYIYPVLGLASETGEVADHVKRIQRDDDGVVTDVKRQEIARELGDVLWYLAQVATEFGLALDQIAHDNLIKLSERQARNTLQGYGDR
jgi:NTP pyrophosphatase (non-canonical NTP hydrolase)